MGTGFKFNKGDRVKLISGRHGSDPTNPVFDDWGLAGYVRDIYPGDEMPFEVVWDNGQQNVYSDSDLDFFEEKKTRTLTTKEDYLNKLLEGVVVMRKIQEMNLEENQIIEDFIQSLIEEMKPEEQREKEKKEQEQKKKEEESKKEKEAGEASEKKSEKKPSESLEKEEVKPEPTSETIKKMFEAMEAAKSGIGKELEEKAFEELRKAETVPDEADGTKPLTEATTGLEIETPYEGGEAQGRNKSVKKGTAGRLYSKPNR